MADYLLATPHGFYFRMKVPPDLRIRLGKRELKKALNTADKKRARLAALLYAARATEIFDLMRGALMSKLPYLGSVFTINGFKQNSDGTISFDSLTTDQTDSPDEKARILSLLTGTVSTPSSIGAAPVVNQPVAGMLLKDAGLAFIAERDETKPWNEYYKTEISSTFDLGVRILGNLPVRSVGRDHGLRLFKVLKQLPPNMNKNPIYVGQSIGQILNLKPAKVLSPQTVNNIMGRVVALFDWLVLREEVKLNPFVDLKAEGSKKASKQRDKFEDDELVRIFSHEVFTVHNFKHAYYFWLPLLSLHSGMRMNEICCIQPKNINQEDGVWMMTITDEDDEKSVKTEAGIRRVPIHPKLIDLGFLDFVKTRKEDDWLFDGLTYSEKKNSRSGYASKWFTERFRPKVELKVKGKDFHSFRHNVVDALKQDCADLRRIKALVGHSRELGDMREDITLDRYGKDYKASILYDLVCKLDFSHVLGTVMPWPAGERSTGEKFKSE